MEPHYFFGFLAVALTLACTPGADWAYSISAGLGQRRIAPAVAGLCGGYVLHTGLVVAGTAAVLAGNPHLLTAITIAGAGYLLWLGVSSARSWRAAAFGAGAAGQSGGAGSFFRGLGTSGINPKGILLYLALVPQFISAEAAFPIPVQTGILGLAHITASALVYTAVAFGARRLLRSRPGAARAVTLASGIIMIALGAVLLGEQLIARFA